MRVEMLLRLPLLGQQELMRILTQLENFVSDATSLLACLGDQLTVDVKGVLQVLRLDTTFHKNPDRLITHTPMLPDAEMPRRPCHAVEETLNPAAGQLLRGASDAVGPSNMAPTDDAVVSELADLAMSEGSDTKIKLTDISEHHSGLIDIQFIVRSSGERFGLHVPLPSSPWQQPWSSDETVTARQWAQAFHQWLVEQVEARYFPDAVRVPYLSISESALRVRNRHGLQQR